jgi:hypothetical protein
VRSNPKKITKAKRAGGTTQVIECLPSKYEALSSNTSAVKINKGVSKPKMTENNSKIIKIKKVR